MDKQKQQLAILGGLGLVLVVLLANAFMPKKKSVYTPPPPDISSTLVIPNVPVRVDTGYAKASSDDLAAQAEKVKKDWGTDPFYHAISKEVYQGSNLALKGVSLGPARRRYATINDEIVTVGDMVFGYRVEEIQKNKVLLKKGTESYYLVWPDQ